METGGRTETVCQTSRDAVRTREITGKPLEMGWVPEINDSSDSSVRLEKWRLLPASASWRVSFWLLLLLLLLLLLQLLLLPFHSVLLFLPWLV